jgi:hypothetical protein
MASGRNRLKNASNINKLSPLPVNALPCQKLESWEAIKRGSHQFRMIESQSAQTIKAFKPSSIPAFYQKNRMIFLTGTTG